MYTSIIVELIPNVALLMILCIVYEISYVIPIKFKNLIPYINGLLIGVIGICIMMVPFKLLPGIGFDTRSILVAVTALIFGTIPVIILASMTILFRLMIGGAGVWMGVSAVISSACIGLIWRKFVIRKQGKYNWLNIYLFGLIIHVAMIACSYLLPWPTSIEVIKAISMPVMLVYPICTVLLSLLLINQKERNEVIIKVAEAEERYRSLFDNNLAIMMIVDPDNGAILDANPAACDFYGWSAQELKAMNISQITTPQEMKNEMEDLVSENKNHFLLKHRRASGQIVDVEVYSGPIVINGQKLIYSIVHEISERVATEKALKESEQRFRLLVENAPDAIFIQTEGKFSYVNRSAIMLFGAESAEQLIDSFVLERFHPDFQESVKVRIYTLNYEKKSVPINEEVILKLDGSLCHVEINAVPIQYNNKDSALTFARDITDRKNLESEKNEMEAQLRQQQKLEAIGTLAGGVAHEINNPINGIMNYAQLILDEVDKNSREAEHAKEIVHETERVSAIVKNLLQFSRQEKQSHSYASIYDIINQTISLIRTIIKIDQIKLELFMDEDIPNIKCRSQQIQQVLMNSLTNARDALNEKYPEYNENKIIRLFCSQYASEGIRWVRIIVEDHGNGIPKKLQRKIFEPFFSTKPKDKGTGLGLSISFGIVKDHHGTITFDTKEGCYTKFILELPVDNEWKL